MIACRYQSVREAALSVYEIGATRSERFRAPTVSLGEKNRRPPHNESRNSRSVHCDTISQLFATAYLRFCMWKCTRWSRERIRSPRVSESSSRREQAAGDGTIDRPINWPQPCDIFSFSITTDELLRRIISTYAADVSKTKRRPRWGGREMSQIGETASQRRIIRVGRVMKLWIPDRPAK